MTYNKIWFRSFIRKISSTLSSHIPIAWHYLNREGSTLRGTLRENGYELSTWFGPATTDQVAGASWACVPRFQVCCNRPTETIPLKFFVFIFSKTFLTVIIHDPNILIFKKVNLKGVKLTTNICWLLIPGIICVTLWRKMWIAQHTNKLHMKLGAENGSGILLNFPFGHNISANVHCNFATEFKITREYQMLKSGPIHTKTRTMYYEAYGYAAIVINLM